MEENRSPKQSHNKIAHNGLTMVDYLLLSFSSKFF